MWKPILPQFKLFSKTELTIVALLVLLVALAFGLGYLANKHYPQSELTAQTIRITQLNQELERIKQRLATSTLRDAVLNGQDKRESELNDFPFVASKNGTRYYPVSCPAAARIKKENQIWFRSAEEAVATGFSYARSCKSR